MPIGALTGRAEIMAPLGMAWGDPKGVFSGGTFSGNPLAMAAGIAAVRHMRDNKDRIYPYLNEQSERLADSVNEFCRENQIAAQLMNAGSIFYMHFQREPIATSRDVLKNNPEAEREFYLHLLGQGVAVPGIHLFFLSTAHTPADVDAVIEAFKQSFLAVRADGLL
jgi:glutamate-1-semialdehyde 2,1-aminomutase